ncbi:hypothetical protein OAM69_00960 [bacterium]|nr:hypothetical protein [bacterium]
MIVLLSIGCDTTLGTHTETERLPTFTIPGATVPSTLEIGLGLAINNPQIDLGAGDSFVTFVTLRGLTLNILDISDVDSNDDGAQDSFDFLIGLDISLRADFNGKTNELMVATLPDGDLQFGSAARELRLTIVSSNIDVLDFLQASDGYEVVLDLQGSIPPDNVTITGALRYRVGLGLDI